MKTKRKIRNTPKYPRYILASIVFNPLYKLLTDIVKGEVDEATDELGNHIVIKTAPAFKEFKGKLYPASDYIEMWCETFIAISKDFGTPQTYENLIAVSKILKSGELEFTEKMLKSAKEELDMQKHIWTKAPYELIEKYTT